MSNATDRLMALEQAVLAEQETLQKKIRSTMIVFAVLAVVVLSYCAFALHKINGYIGPDGLKEYGENTVNLIADQPTQLIRQYDAHKEEWAKLIVNQALDSVPKVEGFLKDQMDAYADQLKIKLRQELFPALTAYLKESAPELKAEFAAAKQKNPNLRPGEFLCDIYIRVLDDELKKNVIDFDAAEDLANGISRQMYALHKGNQPPTNREVAERKILVNFIIIAKMGTADSPFLQDFHDFLRKHLGMETSMHPEGDKLLPEIEGTDGDAEELK